MDKFNLIASAASIVGLALAFWQYYRDQIRKSREEGNIRVLEERIRNVDTSLRSAATFLEILIRRADDEGTSAGELQNLGRAIRANVYGAMMEGRGLTDSLKNWKFGELLETDSGREPDQEEET